MITGTENEQQYIEYILIIGLFYVVFALVGAFVGIKGMIKVSNET